MSAGKTETVIRLIVNGKAAGDPNLREAVALMRERGYRIEVRVTWEFGDAQRLAAEAVTHQVDILVAAGGDGTINEVVTGLLQASSTPEPRLGILPYGTANDFATGLGIPARDPVAALELIVKATPRLIDVGKVNDRCFINMVTAGFGAEVTANTPSEMKKAMGGAAYSLMGLVMAAKMSSWKIKVSMPDDQAEGSMIVMAVGNGRQAGGGYELAPHALLDDGLLDLMVVHDVELPRFGELLAELSDPRSPSNHFVHYRQMPSFTIEAEETIQMNLDGEPMRGSSFEFKVLPKCVKLLGPGSD